MGFAYPPVQSAFDTRLSHSPHGGRTPGRAPARTPFYQNPQSRLSQAQSASSTQPASHPSLPSEAAVSVDPAAEADVSPEPVTDLEALSLADDLGGRRLTPIVTHPISSPSNVILASVTRGRTSELTSAALAQMTQAVESDAARLPNQAEPMQQQAASIQLLADHFVRLLRTASLAGRLIDSCKG